jgi:hypothetical protein
MGLKDKLRRLERDNKGLLVSIPQLDGSLLKFPQSALEEAFLTECARLKGEDLPVHPATLACKNSSDPTWRNSGFAEMTSAGDVEDLSEE